jgi:hypothetical protein
VPFETAKFDLTLFVTESDDGLLLSLEHDTTLFQAPTARRVLETLKKFAEVAE